jgi:transcriptional regulator with XRE-family HTH domain
MMDEGSPAAGVNGRIAGRVRDLRAERGLTLDALARRSGVSRSMISLVERGESSPTAVVLDRLAAGLGVTMSTLFAEAPAGAAGAPLARRADQPVWRDPGSGYVRKDLSPAGFPSPIQMTEVAFPPGARVAYETGARAARVHQQVWMLEGSLELTVGAERHRLGPGDCLAFGLDRQIIFRNPARRPARYVVVNAVEPGAPPRRRR